MVSVVSMVPLVARAGNPLWMPGRPNTSGNRRAFARVHETGRGIRRHPAAASQWI